MKQTNFGASARKFVMGFVMMLSFVWVAGAQSLTEKVDLTPINYKDAAVAQYDLDATMTQLRAYLNTNPTLTQKEEAENSIKTAYWAVAKTSLGNGENVAAADKAGIQTALDTVNRFATNDGAILLGVNVLGTIESARAVVKN